MNKKNKNTQIVTDRHYNKTTMKLINPYITTGTKKKTTTTQRKTITRENGPHSHISAKKPNSCKNIQRHTQPSEHPTPYT
jgi:hypothetical protein